MPRANLFLDSSALFAGIASSTGAARVLLELAECGLIVITVSEQVIAETERALARKAPAALPAYRQALRTVGLRIRRDPSPDDVLTCRDMIAHPADAPILARPSWAPAQPSARGQARQAQTDFLVTLNRRHFIDSGLRIGTPGEALAWIRERGLIPPEE